LSQDRSSSDPIRVIRIIARLNIGGPAIQAITLTQRLADCGYSTVLVRGREEADEGNMDDLAEQLGVRPRLVSSMRRNPSVHDLPALITLIGIVRRMRPRIVHTHAAKGGTLGRVAALVASVGRGRPVLIHTYHGHSLTGYFPPRTTAIYRRIERFLARFCDRLIAVSEEVRDELVKLGVAPASKFEVVRLGFDLSSFTVEGARREEIRSELRAELAIPADARVLTLIARLVPIKRVDRFLRVAQELRDIPDVGFLIVGDGELREQLRSSSDAQALAERLIWAGFRREMPAVCFASDVVIQTSDNEGTPVSLIEAQAAGVPVVSTNVGGAPTVVGDQRQLAAAEDEAGLADAARSLLTDPALARAAGSAGRERVLARFGLERLVSDIDAVYRQCLRERSASQR